MVFVAKQIVASLPMHLLPNDWLHYSLYVQLGLDRGTLARQKFRLGLDQALRQLLELQ